MPEKRIIEPGSLDLDEIHLRLGSVQTDSREKLLQAYDDHEYVGNKFIVAEHFVDPQGVAVDAEVFDHRSMCYSLFTAPIPDKGRHKNVIPFHRTRGFRDDTGLVVGGGLVTLSEKYGFAVEGSSGDYRSEPEFLRRQFADLLCDHLSGVFQVDLQLSPGTQRKTGLYEWSTNRYWLRYRQVLEAAQAYAEANAGFDLDYELQKFVKNQ